MASFEFTLNGSRIAVSGVSPDTTLLEYLRSTGRTGSKEGCAEGDCGACTVALVEKNAHGETTYRAINSCIALLPMFAGRDVVTVEGLAGASLHPVQQAMVDAYGSQCGYCTPGFVMSMFEAYYRTDITDPAQLTDQLNGNLCRCTGYRPIRDAMSNALSAKPTNQQKSDPHQKRLLEVVSNPDALDYAAKGARFVRPTTLSGLLELRANHPEAELVGGATEIGVYRNKQGRSFPFLISTEGVSELAQVETNADEIRIGGAVTLTALEEALNKEFPQLDKMFWVFASRQIRSRATLAGNLVTASPIGDMAPVLLSLDARIVLEKKGGAREIALSDFFLGYRKTAMEKGEIVRAVVLPRTHSKKRLAESYKVSKRRELDISIVAAGFVVDLDDANRVTHARLAFGGVAATPARARKTEEFLVGKLWTSETIDDASNILADEFSPLDDVRSGRAYREGLVVSLFRKFFSGEKSQAQDLPLTYEAGTTSEIVDPSRLLRHESAKGHVTGGAVYVDDEAAKRSMLEMWPVMAPHAHARILKIDLSEAEKVPGVVTILTAKDVPGENDVGAIRKDEPLFADKEAMFHGHIVAVVIGESIAACKLAAKKVAVDYEPLPPILGIKDAIANNSYHTNAHIIRRGDVAHAFTSAAHTLSGDVEIGGQEHFYLESQAAWAEKGDDGSVYVVSSTQHPSEVQAVVSHVLHIARNKVVVQAPRMGGGFGGKETQGNTFASLAALGAWKTGRPVRVQLDRDIDMTLTGKRHPFYATYSVAFESDGQIRGVKASLVSDGGWALDLSESICDRALFHMDNSYYLPAVEFSGRVAKTNVVSHTAFRGFGGPQGMVVIEEIVDRVARALGLRPEDVRQKNLYRGEGESNTTHYGQPLGDQRIPAIFSALRDSAKVDQRRREIDAWNVAHPHVKRGLAITPVKFGISFTASFLNQAGALVLIYRDGTVQVNHGGTEMGQGLYTKILGIAMRELGLPAEAVRVMKTQTDKVPNTSATAASSGSDLNGQAVKAACETLRERLASVAAPLLSEKSAKKVEPSSIVFAGGELRAEGASVAFSDVVEKAYMAQVSLSTTGYYRTPGLAYDKARGKGIPFFYFAYGAAVSEVEVDGFTGMKRVLAVDILHDVGDSLNPGVDRGQIEGAFVQGMGWLTGEELKWDKNGRLLSHSASTYQIPSIGDAPHAMRVALLSNAAQSGVIHGSKAVGEPPLMLAISVREAIRDAVASFGASAKKVPLGCPATHEAIFAGIALQRRGEA